MNWYKLSQKKNIAVIAQEVQKRLLNYYCDVEDEQCLRKKCLEASRKLRDELIKNGYNAHVVRGTFRVDNPDPEACSEMDVNDYSEAEMEEAKYNPLHYWVEMGTTIIDITANQFNNELEEEKMPALVIGTYSQWDRHVYGTDWI